jgi:hypothetical protein
MTEIKRQKRASLDVLCSIFVVIDGFGGAVWRERLPVRALVLIVVLAAHLKLVQI